MLLESLELVLSKVGLAVVGNGIEGRCGAQALAIEVDNGLGSVADKAAVSQSDGLPSEVARCFVADGLELEGVVNSDLAAGFEEEEFLVELGVLKESNAVEVEAKAVDGAHAQGGVFAGVVDVLDPAGELIIEFLEGGYMLQVLIEELGPDSTKKAFYLSLRCSVSYWSMQEDGSEACADLTKLFGAIV